MRIVRERPISTSRGAHSSENEIIKTKKVHTVTKPGRDYGKQIELTGPDRRCEFCGGKIAIKSHEPVCQTCGAIFGSGIKKKHQRTLEQSRHWGADRFMKAMAY